MNLTTTRCQTQQEWDAAVQTHGGHPLQLWGWGELKSAHNWQAIRLLVHDDGQLIGTAQILLRPLPWPFRALAYTPRGPQAAAGRERDVLAAVAQQCAQLGAVSCTVEPDWEHHTQPGNPQQPGTPQPDPATWLRAAGYRPGTQHILIPTTLVLDIRQSEAELQSAMSKKTRQYIRKSARNNVAVRRATAADLPDVLAIYRETAARAQFGIHADDYYRDLFRLMGEQTPIYVATHEGHIVAFLWLARSQTTVFELYGGMNETGQRLLANYTLKWAAILEQQQFGATRYDFNGLLNDGISQFKRGYANHENLLVGTWDAPLNNWYPLYAKTLPLVRNALSAVRSTLRRLLQRKPA